MIFSDPRGGSTWVSEILNQIPRSFIYWEPLSPPHNKDLVKHNFQWRQHIPENIRWKEANRIFDRILRIKVLNEWTLLRVGVRQFLRAKQPIVKFCRGNDLIPWFVKNHPTRRKPLVLIRHPMAVVSSQLKQGGWDSEYAGFNFPTDAYTSKKYEEHRSFLEALETKEEALTATWCLTNKNLLVESRHWLTVYYEDLIREPDAIMSGVFTEWGIPLPETLNSALRKKSDTSLDYVEGNVSEQMSKWQQFFSEDQLNRMQGVLDHFDITAYGTLSIYPQSAGALSGGYRGTGP